MKLLAITAVFCLISSALATYGLYAVVPSSYAYPRRYAVPVGYTHRAPATTTFVKYVEPDTYDYPMYALAFDAELKK